MLTTRVFFALGPKMALLGTFEDDDGVFAAPRELVASYNSMMILSANKQAYAPKLAFPFVDSNGKLEYGNRYWAVRAENELKAKNKSCE